MKMSIEKNLERIADALEALVALATTLDETSTPKAEKKDQSASDVDTKTPNTGPSSDAPPAEDEDGEITAAGLRKLLEEFQNEHGLKNAKELIKPFGASISKLKKSQYSELAEAIANFGKEE
jgi:hypothetical protein